MAQVTLPPVLHTKTILSPVYSVDRKFKSMKGPFDQRPIVLGEGASREPVWITGYTAVMAGADGEAPRAQEFMCHSNVDIDTARHRHALGASQGFNPRLFTLSPGQHTSGLHGNFPAR